MKNDYFLRQLVTLKVVSDLVTVIGVIHNSEGASVDTTAGLKISQFAQFRTFQLKQSQVDSSILCALAVERG